jgi:O-antigen/teichoic acid export membrane protein
MLTPLLRVAFLAMLFRGFTNPQLYVLEKKLMFGQYVWIVNGSALCGTLLCLGMTLYIPNIWALVAGFVAESVVRCIMSFVFCRFTICPRLDRESWKELFHFSKRMAGLPILTFLFVQADIFILGKVFDKELLGVYAMALTLANTPEMIFTRVVVPMVLPVLSETQDRIETLRERLLRMTQVIFAFGFPMATCLAVFSNSVLTILYGTDYAVVSNAFSLLNFYIIFHISGVFIASTYTALGRPDLHRVFTLVRLILFVIILYPGVLYLGATGAAGARVVCMVLAGIVQQWNLSRLIQLPIRRYLMTAKDGFLISAVVLILGLMFKSFSDHPVYHLVTAVVLCTVSWMYIIWTWHKSGHFLSKAAQIRVSVQ